MTRSRLATLATAAILVPTLLTAGAGAAAANNGNGNGNPGGNNGTIKLSTVGGLEDQSNEPHLPCTFEIQWYGFDAGANLYADVSFAGQGADQRGPSAYPARRTSSSARTRPAAAPTTTRPRSTRSPSTHRRPTPRRATTSR